MKSPWRFLADLTSRRKPEPAPLRLPAPEAVIEEDTRDLESSSAAPASNAMPLGAREGTAEAVAGAVDQSPPSTTGTVDAPKDAITPSSPELPPQSERLVDPVDDGAITPPADIVPARPVDAAALKTGTRAAKGVKAEKGRSAALLTPAAIDVPKTQQSASQPLDFLGEVSALDAEIAALKFALAQKLKQQNAQLTKMLARFDVR